jgi:hypothetical protein
MIRDVVKARPYEANRASARIVRGDLESEGGDATRGLERFAASHRLVGISAHDYIESLQYTNPTVLHFNNGSYNHVTPRDPV